MSQRENILQSLFQLLQMVSGPKVLRNESLPEKVPASGLLILRDGDPGEPEVLLSPVSYYWQHRAQLEVIVQKGDSAERDSALDTLLQSVGAALAGNRTLGGLCDYMTAIAPDFNGLAIEGAAQIKGAVVSIELLYTTADPLG